VKSLYEWNVGGLNKGVNKNEVPNEFWLHLEIPIGELQINNTFLKQGNICHSNRDMGCRMEMNQLLIQR